MLIALKTKNFCNLDKSFSFAADSKERAFYPHLISLKQGKFLSVQGFPLLSEEARGFFQSLFFLRQLTVRTDASLTHPNIAPCLDNISKQAEFSAVFRIFGKIYQYSLCLDKEKILTESLFCFFDFSKKNPFETVSGFLVFERKGSAFPVLNVPEHTKEILQNLAPDKTVLSLFKEKESQTEELCSAHAWFRNELFDANGIDFLDYMSERGFFNAGLEFFEGQRIPVSEVQDFLSRDILSYFSNPEKVYFTLKIRGSTIILHKKLNEKNALDVEFTVPPDDFRKFIRALDTVKKYKNRVYVLENITEKLEGILSYLFIKTFLSKREDCFSQLFFSGSDYRIFSKRILRSDEIYLPSEKTETAPQTPKLSEQSLKAMLKNNLPKPQKNQTEFEDKRGISLPPWFWITLIGIIFLFLTAK